MLFDDFENMKILIEGYCNAIGTQTNNIATKFKFKLEKQEILPFLDSKHQSENVFFLLSLHKVI